MELDAATYARAESLLTPYRSALVPRAVVRPHWIDGGARFWYRVEPGEFVLVDPARGTREPAFDHDRLAEALTTASGEAVSPGALPFRAITVLDGAVEFDAFGAHWRYSPDLCEKRDPSVRGPLDVASPDERLAIFRQDHDLWLRDLKTGEQKRLTHDGTADHAYGAATDAVTPFTLLRRLGLSHLPPAVVWSPDSSKIVLHRTDQRGVRVMPLVEAAPPGGGAPEVFTQRYPLPGDEAVPLAELMIIDVVTGSVVRAESPPLPMLYVSPIHQGRVWWAADGSAVYVLEQTRDQRTLRLNRLDPATGEVRTLVEESGTTRTEPAQQIAQRPIVRVLDGTGEVIWYSQRDGWGHLYLYGEPGDPPRRLTSGAWGVQQILHVDEDARTVVFVATGLVAGSPYRRQVCRAGLDGTGFQRLGDDDLDHAVQVPDSSAYFVDSASTVSTAPVTTVRDWDGGVLAELERADVTPLLEAGWRPPEEFTTIAADGVSEIHGLLYKPAGFDPGKSYAVVDHPYPGPQAHRVHAGFDAGFYGHEAEAAAALGFAVVAVDGRGTPGRSKEFHDESYGRLGDAGGLADHVAAIRQLAQTRPWLDLDRVGVFGMSGGGFATVRALCAYPDFYRVGVAECGNHDQRLYHALWGESYDGPVDAEVYARSANTEIADRLQGRLLLVHGEMDDNVTPHLTMRLADRLIAANKDFDLLIVPGAEHSFVGYGHYVTRRRWDYLVRHLMGAEPPRGYRLKDIPLTPELLDQLMGA
ncbi:DPP IV N-terminal domain-containing protein [Spongiactinospora sp. 9N601]|uniref:S9 family peptidase n=1 Tax=Spongiactinospora sp. 9N601 TaxID=3375149 RepID=UPI0037895DE4